MPHDAAFGSPDVEVWSFGPFRFQPTLRSLLTEGGPVQIGARALDLLTILIENAGRVVSHGELIARVWPTTVVEDSSLRVHIAGLRKALGDGQAGARFIINVPNRGYSFVAPVQRRGPGDPADPQAAAPRAAPAGQQLPAQPSRLIGREAAVAELGELLRRRRLVTIVGPGGIGKTSVALALGTALAGEADGSVRFLDLAPLAEGALVGEALAGALGVPAPAEDPIRSIAAHLHDSTMLLVLDNCEHVVDAAAEAVIAVLQAAPNVRCLVTSRQPLRVGGETVYPLSPLDAPTSWMLGVDELLRFPAVQLFIERASVVIDPRQLAEDEIAALAEICGRLEGIPLAIELAAALVDLFGVRGLAHQLDDQLSLLTRGRRTALPRHRTLRATLDWSFNLLSPLEQQVLLRLSAFTGSFTIEEAQAAPGLAELDPDALLAVVSDLVEKSLLVADVTGEQPLLRLLDMTRAYAAEKLAAANGRRQARGSSAA